MEHQLRIERAKVAEITRHVTTRCHELLEDSDTRAIVQQGSNKFGIAFTAFALTPVSAGVRTHELHEAFKRVHLLTAVDRETARKAVLEMLHETGQLDRIVGRLDAAWRLWLLMPGIDALREALEEEFSFVETSEGCHVFDKRTLGAEFDS